MQSKVWITFLVGVLAAPVVANAHNLGHIFLPDGTCQEVGSAKDAPLVGQDRSQLDLVPQTPNPPRDEYGTSFVGFWGQTPIFPGRCPIVTGTSSVSGVSASASSGPTAGDAGSQPAPAGLAANSGTTAASGTIGRKKGK
jgi:hypothetical protein